MISLIQTADAQHTASTDAEIVQVVIHLLGTGAREIAIMKDVYHDNGQPTDGRADAYARS